MDEGGVGLRAGYEGVGGCHVGGVGGEGAVGGLVAHCELRGVGVAPRAAEGGFLTRVECS